MMLEQFLVEWLGDSLYRRRKQLCGGVPGIGFEMWRWLYQEFQGGSEAVMLGGSRRLQDFPRCSKLDQLSAHLDDWVECLNTYCAELLHAPGVLRSMLLGVIPADFEDELLSNPQVKSWQEIIQWCKIKTVYKRQKLLAEAARKPGARVNAVLTSIDTETVEVEEGRTELDTAAKPNEPPAWFKDYVNRLEQKGDRSTGSKPPTGDRRATGDKAKSTRIVFKGC